MWALSRSSFFGIVTTARLRFASPSPVVSCALTAGCPRRFVDPFSFNPSFGAKLRFAQLATWNRPDWSNSAPSLPKEAVSTLSLSQLVGLSVKLGRSRLTSSERSRSGTPSRIWGIGSETVFTWAVTGSTEIAERTTTLPRS